MSSIKLNSSETFSFTWLDDKNKTIATSTNFVKQKDCLEAIELLKDKCFDAAIENRIDPDSKKSSFPKFIITGTSRSCTFAFALSEKNTVLSSVKFNSLALCLETIESIKKNVISVYEQFKIDLRVDNYLNELNEKNVRQDSTKINIVKQGLRKMPVFMAKKSTPLFATKKDENDNLKKLNGDRPLILRISRGKRPTFVDGKFTAEKVTSLKKAVSALNSLHHTMGFKNVEQEFKEHSSYLHAKADFYRLQQYHQGIPVYGRQLIVSTDKNGNVASLSGRYAEISSTNSKVVVSEDDAIDFVKKLTSETTTLTSDGLYYYVDDNDKATLCWKISTDSLIYFIDVAKAVVVDSLATCFCKKEYVTQDVGENLWNDRVTFPVLVQKNKRYLYDPKRDIEVLRCRKAGACKGDKITSPSSEWKNEKEAISAYTNVIKVYDYYDNQFGRKGADGEGRSIKVVVDYFEKVGEPYGGGACYMDRNGNSNICIGSNYGYERCLDVVAHEYTHGVENFIWHPVYKDESGAIDEAYADIMGEFVQDGVLDEYAEDGFGGPDRYFDDPTKSNDRYSKDYANRFIGPCDEKNDYGGVHYNCGIICHAAYKMQENWPSKDDFSAVMPAVFYLSMYYLDPGSNFLHFREALLHAARVYNLGKEKENVILNALDDVGIVYPTKEEPEGPVLKGTVVDSSGNPVRDAMVYLMDPSCISKSKATVTNELGQFSLKCESVGVFELIVESIAYEKYSRKIRLSNSGYDCGSIKLNRKITPDEEEKVLLEVSVKHPITKNIENVDVYICEGTLSDDAVLNKENKIKRCTDAKGFCSTTAVKLNEKYTVVAQKKVSSGYIFGSRMVTVNEKIVRCDVNLDKNKCSYINDLRVSWSDGTRFGKERVRNRIKGEGYILVDKDLNYGAHGYYIYLGYKVSINDTRPVTNVVIYSSPKKQTWHDMNITVLGKKANYVRHDVDLNNGAGGNYVYLCETRDPQFAPLTGIDVEIKGDYFDGSWERAIGVETTDSGRDRTYNGDVNHKTRHGDSIFIRIKRD